ncbi:uncharacterized protein LOC123523090 [Mercenaria mercenaria]|uniref:uncharacterized protein LOC123523090 n=1 Tax=Mercenaria mercenaria TaxID=6596 RepID=UPI001E1D2590|nr:uncharacterized protein LOC123523090 [Mercenaria mercenaria]
MNMLSCIVTLLASVYSVRMYPTDDLPLYPDYLVENDYPDTFYDQDVFLPYTSYQPSPNLYPGFALSKRQEQHNVKVNKRATLNQLLRRLIALYGNNDIAFSGRSSHVRFGAGGR